MLDSIILLSGPVEVSALAGALRAHNPQLEIHLAKSLVDLEAIGSNVLRRARLIGFVTPVVVPAQILNSLGYGAYNFHPGPPHYPGWVPAHFAVYDRAAIFGATVHVMIERVDAGPIVATKLFPAPQNANAAALEGLAFVALAHMFWKLAKLLATQREPLQTLPIQWSGRKSSRRLYTALCEISSSISKEELDRRIEAFGAGQLGIVPTITVHGHKFCYVDSDAKIQEG